MGVDDSIGNAQAAFPDSPAGATETCPSAKKAPGKSDRVVQCVTRITATTPGTSGVRKVNNKVPERPDNVLRGSQSPDKNFSSNKPVVLIRGCKDVLLEAVTTPPDTPVSWKVEANHTANSPPAIEPDGVKATLKTNVEGSFSVIATLAGCKVVWNVVFVWVKVDIGSSQKPKETKHYAENGSSGTDLRFRSGRFNDTEFAFRDKLKVTLIGGGDDKMLGVEKVKLHVLQNCARDTLTAHYAPPPSTSTALEKPKGGVPILDSTDEKSPFLTDSSSVEITNSSKVDWEVMTTDSPGANLPRTHKFTSKPIASVSGFYKFETLIASVSDDAGNTIVVHACITWTADFSGTVDKATGDYVPGSAKTTPAASWTLLFEDTGGKDAGEAHIETFEPRFNDLLFGADFEWDPLQ